MWLMLTQLVMMVQISSPDTIAESLAAQAGTQIQSQEEKAVVLEDVDVRARRGAALMASVTELDGAEIDALNVWSIGELLTRLDEIYGAKSAPLVLVNGKKVPDPSVFNGFAPDAAVRIEVLPAEASAVYGAGPGQTVYNLVLQSRYDRKDLSSVASRPLQGGTSSLGVDIRQSHIRGSSTHNMNVLVSRDTALRANERQISSGLDGPEAGLVTLRPESHKIEASAMMTLPIGNWATVASLQANSGRDYRTAVLVAEAQYSELDQQSVSGSFGISGQAAGWHLFTNLGLNLSQQTVVGFDAQTSENLYGMLHLSAQRPLLTLPAGQVSTNLDLRVSKGRFEQERAGNLSAGLMENRDLKTSFAVPLITEGPNGLGRMGSLQASLGLGLSDGGAGIGEERRLGLNWSRAPGIRFSLNWISQNEPMSDILRSQPAYLGNPRAVYDFREGRVVDVLPLLGGVDDLLTPSSENLSLSAGIGPLTSWRLMTTITYNQQSSENGISTVGDITEAFELAFPERFVRDVEGRLLQVDFRPMNLSQSQGENLGLILSLSLPSLSKGQSEKTVTMNLGYSRQLKSQSMLLPFMPVQDRLAGDAGGLSSQSANLGLNMRKGAWGSNLSARWQQGYRSRYWAGIDDPRDLVRHDMMTADLSLSWRPMHKAHKLDGTGAARKNYAGLEMGLSISNLFDSRPRAHLGDGSPAPGYDRDRYDPIGRRVQLTLRQGF